MGSVHVALDARTAAFTTIVSFPCYPSRLYPRAKMAAVTADLALANQDKERCQTALDNLR